jgi:ATP-dependent DNA helicase RecG
MLKELLTKDEGKTLEFKESTESLQKIIQTIVAFANTAGGTLVIGIRDKTKEIVGLDNILQEEERLANAVADSISPQLNPSFQLHTWRNRDLLIVSVSHNFGPYFVKSKGLEKGVYIRLGSTNRLADQQTISQIQRLQEHKYFDEQPNFDCAPYNINLNLAKKLFADNSKNFTSQTARSLGFIVQYQAKELTTNGAVLLFADNLLDYFPDAYVRLGRFLGIDKSQILDHVDLSVPISIILDQILAFIRRHTTMGAEIGATKRRDIPQYPSIVLREAIINALVHTDYSIKGASITVAIFDDRIEITNPGCLPFGLSMEAALSGISQLRNRVIGRVFRALNLIEQWGSGLGRMQAICLQHGIQAPKIEEIGNFFKVTLYHNPSKKLKLDDLQKPIVTYLKKHKKISPKKAQGIWNVTTRTTSSRLKKMCELGILAEISTGPFDPQKTFSLRNNR